MYALLFDKTIKVNICPGRTKVEDWKLVELPDPDEFAQKMKDIFERGDTETDHSAADGLMSDLLDKLGYSKAVDIFWSSERWYA